MSKLHYDQLNQEMMMGFVIGYFALKLSYLTDNSSQVAVLPPISINKIGCKCRINSETRRCQLRATDIIDHLKLSE